MRPCSNSAVARLARIAFWCEDDPPRRGPLVGLGIATSPKWGRSPYQVGPGRNSLELFGFGVVGDLGWVEAGRAVLERQTQLMQLDLHLVDRLLTEVADVEQVRLGARHQF